MGDRGVSEVVGFVLIFSLVISTVGVVYVTGFNGLEDARDAERINNGERAFDVLSDNLEDMYRDGAPSRGTEVKLADAQLTLAEPTTIQVTVEDITDDAGNPIVHEANVRPLVFSTGGPSKIVYENGAVIRVDRNGAIMQEAPPFLISEERTVLGYIVTQPAGGASVSVGGDATVLVRTVRTGQNTLVQDYDDDVRATLSINTTTARAAVWEEYVNERADWSNSDWDDGDNVPCEITDPNAGDGRSEVVCTFEPDELYLSSTGIETYLTS
jgi:hypothetical protein